MLRSSGVAEFGTWGLGGLGRAAPGDERIGLAVLSPPRTILSQARISRGKGGWGVLASAALPRWGKVRCRCAYSTLFAPAGQKRCRGARRILAGPRERVFCGGVLPIRKLSRRARETELRGTSHRLCFSRRIFGARHTVETGFSPFTTFSRPQKAIFPPSPPRLLPQTIPRGDRRALPAPAQGSKPLRIPFWGRQPFPPRLPSPNRRRQTAPARGPSAVYALCRWNRNETKRPCPLLVGHGCVNTEPTALAGGTAGPHPLKGFIP